MKTHPRRAPSKTSALGLLALAGAWACQSGPPEPTSSETAPASAPAAGAPSLAPASEQPTRSGAQPGVAPEAAAGDPERPVPVPEDLAPMVDAAKQHLAARLSVAEDELSVLVAERVTWSDSSLGCPQGDAMYMQVLTPGARVVLGRGTEQFHYHAGQDLKPMPCANPKPPAGGAADR